MTRVATLRHEASDDGVVHALVLDAPPANVIGSDTCAQLSEALDALASDERARVVVLRGQGDHFSYGASIEEHLPESAPRMLSALSDCVAKLLELDVPTIAAVRGRCLGGGFELALACGLVFADEAATFAAPEITLGVFAPVATALLGSRIPRAVAEELVLTGRTMPAREAATWGLCNRVIDDARFEEELALFVDRFFRSRPAFALRVATRAVRLHQRRAIERVRRLEQLYVDELLGLPHRSEGIRAFMEKRPPRWETP